MNKEECKLNKEEKFSQSLTVAVICISCVIVLVWRLLELLNVTLHSTYITLIFEGIALLFAVIFAMVNKLSFSDFGIRIKNAKKTILESLAISAVLIIIGVLAKLVLMKIKPDFFPADAPFFRLKSRSLLGYFYIVTCFIQEVLARGFLQSSFDRTVKGKYKTLTVLVLSALMFSLFHIHLGFLFMIAAGALVAVLGILYERHGSIWGTFIVHYLVGYSYIHLFITA